MRNYTPQTSSETRDLSDYVIATGQWNTLIFYKQLGSGLSPQHCLYLQGFRVSKSLKDTMKAYICHRHTLF